MSGKTPKQSKKLKPGERGKLIASAATRNCYKPDCQNPLFIENDGHWISAFDVAHIRDEKKPRENDQGIGHRYFPEEDMSLAERNQYANLILLCKTCHKLIDTVAPLDYSVELLHEWKQQAETDELRARLTELFGDKVLSEKDWSEALLDGSAVHAVHAATEQELEALDNRLLVSSSYQNGELAIQISAKDEPVPVTWTFEGGNGAQLDGFFKMAQPISIPTSDVTITGSDLFTKLVEQDGMLTMLPSAKPALLKLKLSCIESSNDFQFDDISGNIRRGSEVLLFDGSCFGGLVSVHLQVPLSSSGVERKFSFNVDLTTWQNVEIQKLPYFNKLMAFLLALENKRLISGVLEFNGERLFDFKADTKMDNVDDWGAYQIVQFTNAARIIAKYFEVHVSFYKEFKFSAAEHNAVYQLMKFLGFVQNPSKEFIYTTSHVATEEAYKVGSIENRAFIDEPSDLIENMPAMDIQLFDQLLSIPKRVSVLGRIVPRIVGEKPKLGDQYQVEWHKTDDTVTRFYFEDEENPIPKLPQK